MNIFKEGYGVTGSEAIKEPSPEERIRGTSGEPQAMPSYEIKSMKKMKKKMKEDNFAEWLRQRLMLEEGKPEIILKEGGRRTAGKTILYPLSYAGLGLYPPADYLTRSADAIVYLTKDERLYHNGDRNPFDIRHLPGHKQYGDKANNGDSEPFNINNLPGKITPYKNTTVPGKVLSFKNWINHPDPKIICPKDSIKTPINPI